ncbi:carboxypeptidase-like regulatory domain-containing protein [Mucilaginibacter auburnensis]|uniref:Carboxypeptidase-like protein n=1 Tax=Mucilaginibacter auburnensis TaxID=1457233 RepID=A0A2H9VNZ8_9SPHI|nr:carboxypeptidase-like regulatory domain-containing protein [Mucilaginibacter auburnensis]PJJ80042.1 carboxypeptidase-like protein [Mucilaginibacter auburnensis]
MNKFIFYLLFILTAIVLSYSAFAQKGEFIINGKVTEQGGTPIRQATVSINNKGIGTSTNQDGLFILHIPTANVQDTLNISCIGYQTDHIPIANLKDGQSLEIKLAVSNTELLEVTITHYDAVKIIQKAISRIPQNNINQQHLLRGFYRMYTYKKDVPLQLSEAVFDVFNFGYGDKRADLFKLAKARNEKNTKDFSSIEFGQRPNTIFEQDIVNHLPACGFLNEEGIERHEFEVNGIVDINGRDAYQVDFKEKPGQTKDTYRGQMFIDTKTYAFLYFDYGLSPAGLATPAKNNFVLKSLVTIGGVGLKMTADHMRVNYQQVNNKWVLASVEGSDAITVSGPSPKDNYNAQIKFNYQITKIDTNEEPIESNIGRNESINNYKSSGGEKFWKDYNILLSDFNADEVLKKIQAINKGK